MDEALETPSGAAAAFAAAAGGAAPPFVSGLFSSVETISRATSPGLPCREQQEDDKKRYRPRTFSYFRLLPFEVEDDAHRDAALRGILKNLYISIMAEDFSPGALHWTRELQGWLNLKFEMTRDLRARLARLYYHLALAPGLESNTADRFARMVITLTRLAPPARSLFGLKVSLRNTDRATSLERNTT
jgi:proteasome activator subunit 4